VVDSKTKARISKTLQQKLQKQNNVWGGNTTVRKQISGTASSVAFTPLQVRMSIIIVELLNTFCPVLKLVDHRPDGKSGVLIMEVKFLNRSLGLNFDVVLAEVCAMGGFALFQTLKAM
jgi:hypothetical protein